MIAQNSLQPYRNECFALPRFLVDQAASTSVTASLRRNRLRTVTAQEWPGSRPPQTIIVNAQPGTRKVNAALKAMPIKTDRRDAEGIARLLLMGWFRPVHCKSVSSQEMRALLTSRRSLVDALTDMELSLRGVLRNFGLKLGQVSKGRYEARVRELVAGNAMLEAAAEPILRVRAALRRELAGLEKLVRNLAREDPVCRLPMTMPGVGHVIALTFMSAIDDPERFRRSKDVGPWVGLTPGRDQSGERDIVGGITKCGDAGLRTALYQAATVMLNRARSNWLKAWALRLAKMRGKKRATVALARRIGVVLRRMWRDGTEFRFTREERWRSGRCRRGRGCISPAVSKERRKEPRLKVAIHRCPLAGTRFPIMHVQLVVCRTASCG